MYRQETVTVYLGDVALELTGDYSPEEPERGPTYSCGGEPGCDADFDVTAVTIGGADADHLWNALKDRTRDILIAEGLREIEGGFRSARAEARYDARGAL